MGVVLLAVEVFMDSSLWGDGKLLQVLQLFVRSLPLCFGRKNDLNDFLAAGGAVQQFHLFFGHAKGTGRPGQQGGVGLAIYRRRGQAQAQSLLVHAGKLRGFGTGRSVDGDFERKRHARSGERV